MEMAIKYHTIDPEGDLLLLLNQPLPNANVGATSTDVTPSAAPVFVNPANASIANSTFGGSVQPQSAASPVSEVQMLVSSRHLTSASPVFKAMLRSNTFREGQTLSATGKVSVPLPDDDPDALKLLLDILHHRTLQVPKTISLSTMTNLTILVDKYQMVEVLGAYQHIWLGDENLVEESFPTTFSSPNFLPWLAISWVFKLHDIFIAVTKLALQESEAKIQDCTHEGRDLPIPTIVLGMKYRRLFILN